MVDIGRRWNACYKNRIGDGPSRDARYTGYRMGKSDSAWELRADLATTKLLIWVATLGREADLTSDTHLYFFDRYQRLADHHRKRGNQQVAARLQAKADEHYRAGGGDGPPYAAAMGMPRPRTWIVTNAVSRGAFRDPDDVA